MRHAASLQTDDPASPSLPWYALRRSTRVLCLTFVILALSLADLYCTLIYLHSGGMGEENPVARWLMGHGSPLPIILWKLGTVGLACCILAGLRHKRLGELGALLCCTILVWLTFRWNEYNHHAGELTSVIHTVAETSPRWVQMGD